MDNLSKIRAVKSTHDLEAFKFELRNEIEIAHADKMTIEEEKNALFREIVDLDAKKAYAKAKLHPLTVAYAKCRENIRRMNAEMKQAEEMFWSLKNQGL